MTIRRPYRAAGSDLQERVVALAPSGHAAPPTMLVMVTEDQIAQAIVCGPDPERHLEKLRAFDEAG